MDFLLEFYLGTCTFIAGCLALVGPINQI